MDKDLVFGDPTAPRFVFWDKKLRATPSGLDIITFDLLSIFGKIRAGLGAVGIVKGPAPGARVCRHGGCAQGRGIGNCSMVSPLVEGIPLAP